MTLMGWAVVIVAWLGVAVACLQTTQGIYEDHVQVAAAARRPIVLAPRGLARWLTWMQVQRFGAVPWQFRAINLALAAIVSGLVGLFVQRLGLTAWIAAGVMALHPLMIETVVTLSGRAELLAAIGVLGACVIATMGRMRWWTVLLSMACLGFGVLGKESAIVGVALVPLTWTFVHPRDHWTRVFWVGCAVLVLLLIAHRFDATWSDMAQPAVSWALLQSGAFLRVCALAVLPLNQTLDFDYDALPRLWFVAAGASVLVLGWIAVTAWHGWRVLGFSLTWILIVAVPRLLVQTPRSYFNEHQFYLALVGVALTASALADALTVHLATRRRVALFLA